MRALRHNVRIAGLIVLAVLLAPSLLILVYRVADPPLTPLMIKRWIEGHGMVRDWRPLAEISPQLRFAVIASEDNLFCKHRGFDWAELRGQVERMLAGERARGASTISMQTTKNLFLTDMRSPLRKLAEAWLTPQLELMMDERRILELYLNIIEFGPGIYGAQAAAMHHFGIEAKALDRRQAAALAAILPAPLARAPGDGSEWVRARTAITARRIDQLGPLPDCVRD